MKFVEYRKNKHIEIIKKIFYIYVSILLPPYGIAYLIHSKCRKGVSISECKSITDREKITLFNKKHFQVEEFKSGLQKYDIEIEKFQHENEQGQLEVENIILEKPYQIQ